MERAEAYRLIKEKNLQDEVKRQFGDNYTRVSTENLAKVIWQYDCTLVDKDPDPSTTTQCTQVPAENYTTENPYEAACVAFVGILKDSGLLEDILVKL